MQTTYILRNITPEMVDALAAMDVRDAIAKLNKWAFGDLRHCVTQQCGHQNSFGDRVRFNAAVRDGKPITFRIEPRRGYKLVTFEWKD